jgi:hypothetical protein
MPSPDPQDPVFRGVENEPWARYAGEGGALRLLTALFSRRRQRGNPPLPPILPVVVAVVALLIVLAGLTVLVMWLFGGS